MQIYESYRRTNFLLIYTMVIMHILHMLRFAAFPTWISCIFYALVCIYVGSTRSLNFYNVKEESQSIKNEEN